MKRLADFIFGEVALSILLVPLLLVALSVRITSPGAVLYWSDREGESQQPSFQNAKVPQHAC